MSLSSNPDRQRRRCPTDSVATASAVVAIENQPPQVVEVTEMISVSVVAVCILGLPTKETDIVSLTSATFGVLVLNCDDDEVSGAFIKRKRSSLLELRRARAHSSCNGSGR